MKNEILSHIRALSESRLGQMTALERFAHCLNSVYGDCSFLSFDVCADSGRFLVRLIFSDTGNNGAGISNLRDQHVTLEAAQLQNIVRDEAPVIVGQIDVDLVRLLEQFRLPSASMMCMPVYLDGAIRFWVMVLGHKPEQFAEVDLQQAVLLANLAATYMARITETEQLASANAWIKKELNDIGRIHQLLLPQTQIEIQGTDVASFLASCDQAGGDYYDVVNLSQLFGDELTDDGDEAWGAIVADASGHGAASAVEIAMFDALLRTYQGSVELGPAGVFNYTNKYFFTRIGRGSFISAVIITYLPESENLIYASAGHPPVLVITPQGQIQRLEKGGGIPLGVDPDWQWENMTQPVTPGSIVVAYTDGILESQSLAKQQFGLVQLEQTLLEVHQSGSRRAQDYIDAVVQALDLHQQGQARVDDQALLVMSIAE